MQQVKSYCDHCGKELNAMNDYCSLEIEIITKMFYADLCENCKNKLVNIVGTFIRESKNNG